MSKKEVKVTDLLL